MFLKNRLANLKNKFSFFRELSTERLRYLKIVMLLLIFSVIVLCCNMQYLNSDVVIQIYIRYISKAGSLQRI